LAQAEDRQRCTIGDVAELKYLAEMGAVVKPQVGQHEGPREMVGIVLKEQRGVPAKSDDI